MKTDIHKSVGIAANLIKSTAKSVAEALDVKGTKDDIAHIKETFATHAQSDINSFNQINISLANCATKKDIQDLHDAMAPIIKTFHDNNIVKMRLSSDAKTIFFYVAGFTSIIVGWLVFKSFIISLFK